jgi:hypothetical protein
MIDAMEAVAIAKQKAIEILGSEAFQLEEIERDTYKEHDVWSITLSLPRDLSTIPPMVQISIDPLKYKRFLIDSGTGELLAVKLRELAVR